jgi:hypothetical protein
VKTLYPLSYKNQTVCPGAGNIIRIYPGCRDIRNNYPENSKKLIERHCKTYYNQHRYFTVLQRQHEKSFGETGKSTIIAYGIIIRRGGSGPFRNFIRRYADRREGRMDAVLCC